MSSRLYRCKHLSELADLAKAQHWGRFAFSFYFPRPLDLSSYPLSRGLGSLYNRDACSWSVRPEEGKVPLHVPREHYLEVVVSSLRLP